MTDGAHTVRLSARSRLQQARAGSLGPLQDDDHGLWSLGLHARARASAEEIVQKLQARREPTSD